jgi:type IV pilus assembly protein PilY1
VKDKAGNPCDYLDTVNNPCFRITEQNTVTPPGQKGWYMDLYNTVSNTVNITAATDDRNLGERVVSTPILRSGRIIFTTLQPSTDSCEFGGTGWLMELDAKTGGRLTTPPFDVDNPPNGVDKDDLLNGGGQTNVTPGGLRSRVGIMPRPTVLALPGTNLEIKYAGGSMGTISATQESASGRLGRITWRELTP